MKSRLLKASTTASSLLGKHEPQAFLVTFAQHQQAQREPRPHPVTFGARCPQVNLRGCRGKAAGVPAVVRLLSTLAQTSPPLLAVLFPQLDPKLSAPLPYMPPFSPHLLLFLFSIFQHLQSFLHLLSPPCNPLPASFSSLPIPGSPTPL